MPQKRSPEEQQDPNSEALRALVFLLARQAAREALTESTVVPDAPDDIHAIESGAEDGGR